MPATYHDVESIPFLSWSEFCARFRWAQGEHVTLIGRTGCGKSTLSQRLAQSRKYVVVIATKPKDPILAEYKKLGYHITRTWPAPDIYNRVVLWPPAERLDSPKAMQSVISKAMGDLFDRGSFTVLFDETQFTTEILKLDQMYRVFMQQGRTLGLSIVSSGQRPFHLPQVAFNQATHMFMFRESDKRNRDRFSDMNGVDGKLVSDVVATVSTNVW